MKEPLALKAYHTVTSLAAPLLPLLLRLRLSRGKEDAARLSERLGEPGRERPEGLLIWLHCASVGETMSVLPLIEALVRHGTVMLTSGTVTSAALAAKRLPMGAFHQFVPLDAPQAVHRFLAHWQPDLGLFCESELWPNLMMEAHHLAIPVGIVNGRMSDRSFRRWQKLDGLIRALLSPLAICTAQSPADAERFRALGAPATSPGNLKFDVPALPVDEAAWEVLSGAIEGRPAHQFEAAAARDIRSRMPDLLTFLVPRHPARGEAIADLAGSAPRRSLGAIPGPADAFYVADTMGELGLFYRAASVALIGGSLVAHGGHNPIEAIKWRAPVVSGPHVANFRAIFADLAAAEGVRMLAPGEVLAGTLEALLADASARDALASRGLAALARHEGALQRTMADLQPFLRRKAP